MPDPVELIRERLPWWAVQAWDVQYTEEFSIAFDDPSSEFSISTSWNCILSSRIGRDGMDIGENATCSSVLKERSYAGGTLVSETDASGNTIYGDPPQYGWLTIHGYISGDPWADTYDLELALPAVTVNGTTQIPPSGMPAQPYTQAVVPFGARLDAHSLPTVVGTVHTDNHYDDDHSGVSDHVLASLKPVKWRPALIKVWLNVFIAGLDENAVEVPNSNHQLTMIPNPLHNPMDPLSPVGFATDNRGFSNYEQASSRVSATFTIWMGMADEVVRKGDAIDDSMLLDLMFRTSGTTGYDQNGAVLAVGATDLSGCSISNLRWSQGDPAHPLGLYEVDVIIQASDPLVLGAPDVDLKGTIGFEFFDDTGHGVTVSFIGLVDPWPHFEMYAEVVDVPDQAITTIFQMAPGQGTGPFNLPGNPSQGVGSSEVITSDGPIP